MIGQNFGNFRIVRKLGEGGMGQVFEAIHDQIGRRAAIKILHPEFARDPNIAKRFLNEARAANLVQHPGIVGVFEIGQTPDGCAFIVMEYLDGYSLGALLQRASGPLGLNETLRISRQLASILGAAHAKGIIHRDLKPDNVMIVPDPEAPGGERVKLLDFGIAKLAAELSIPGGTQSRTRTGMLMGTPTYMSPEQCRGAGDINDRSDVYALGVILYQMIAGRPPFIAEGVGEVLAMHIFRDPEAVQKVSPGLPPQMAELVHHMLAKKAVDRPTMRQVAAQLEAVGAPGVQAVPVSVSGADAPTRIGPSSLSLSALTGQLTSSPARSQAALIAGLGLVICVIAAGLYQVRSRTTPVRGVNTPQPAAAPANVRWEITSQPTGATVVNERSGATEGQTPWRRVHVAGIGQQVFLLRLPGYAERRLVLDLALSSALTEHLDPLAPPVKEEPHPIAPEQAAPLAESPSRPVASDNQGSRRPVAFPRLRTARTPAQEKAHPPKASVRSDDDIKILD